MYSIDCASIAAHLDYYLLQLDPLSCLLRRKQSNKSLHETVLCPLSESQSENFVPQTAAITTKKLRLFETDIVLSLDEAVNLQLNNMKRDRTCPTRTTLGDNNKVSATSLLSYWSEIIIILSSRNPPDVGPPFALCVMDDWP